MTSRARQRDQAAALVAGHGTIVAEFFNAGESRTLAWARRPEAGALVAALADPDRGWNAIVIGEYERAFYGSQYASMAPLFKHYGIQLWMPEAGGPVDGGEDHEQLMLALGLQSRREITRTRIQDLIEAVKQAIKAANVSRATDGRDLQIGSVRLTLHAVATRSYGGGLNFRIPLIGTEVNLGGKLSRQDTHEIEISMVPPAPGERPELRDSNLGDALVEAIETIRAALVAAADGEDPFVLKESKITIVFGVTSEGDISVGVNGSLNDELTQTLTLSLVPASA